MAGSHDAVWNGSWVNHGSCKDLSHIQPVDPVTALAPTSQAGGNMLAQEGNDNAMTAPGSEPVDNLNDHQSQVHEDPTIVPSNSAEIEPADDGKPQASGQASYSAPPAAWKYRVIPDVVRKPMR